MKCNNCKEKYNVLTITQDKGDLCLSCFNKLNPRPIEVFNITTEGFKTRVLWDAGGGR